MAINGEERRQKSRNRLWAAERALVLGRENRDVVQGRAFPAAAPTEAAWAQDE